MKHPILSAMLPKDSYSTKDTQDMGYCASGIKAITNALWWYAEYGNTAEEFPVDVQNMCGVIGALAEPLNYFLFSNETVKRGRK